MKIESVVSSAGHAGGGTATSSTVKLFSSTGFRSSSAGSKSSTASQFHPQGSVGSAVSTGEHSLEPFYRSRYTGGNSKGRGVKKILIFY
jgi:hypothetical protein